MNCRPSKYWFSLALLFLALPVLASTYTAGTWKTVSFIPVSATLHGTDVVMTEDVSEFDIDGDMQGKLYGKYNAIVRASTGAGTYSGVSRFVGTYNGLTGILYFTERGKISDGVFVDSSWTIVDSEGELAGLRGHGTYTGMIGGDGVWDLTFAK